MPRPLRSSRAISAGDVRGHSYSCQFCRQFIRHNWRPFVDTRSDVRNSCLFRALGEEIDMDVPQEEVHVGQNTARARFFRILRDRIISGALAPGTALRELELADELQISRSRLREVLALLEQRGLVER